MRRLFSIIKKLIILLVILAIASLIVLESYLFILYGYEAVDKIPAWALVFMFWKW